MDPVRAVLAMGARLIFAGRILDLPCRVLKAEAHGKHFVRDGIFLVHV